MSPHNRSVLPGQSKVRAGAIAAGQVAVSFAAAAVANAISQRFQIEAGVSIFFPLTAVSILACMWLGLRGALGVALAVLAAPWGEHVDSRELVLSALIIASEGLIPYYVFRSRPGLSSDLRDVRSLLAFLLFGTVLNNVFASIAGNLLVVDHPGVLIVWPQVFMWWLADFTAALLIATPALAFGGALTARRKEEGPRSLANGLQVVAVILLLGFAASFAIRTSLLNRLERERLDHHAHWLQARSKVDRIHTNLVRAALLDESDPGSSARLESARRIHAALLRELAPSVTEASPELAREFPMISRVTSQWFEAARSRLEGRRPGSQDASTIAETTHYVLALRSMTDRANEVGWIEYGSRRQKIMLVSGVVDGTVFVTLVLASVMLFYSISRPFAQLQGAVRAMGEGEPLDAGRIDGRYLEFRSVALRLEEASRELRRREDQLRLQTERAMEASRHKSDFLAKMSHELRTPLNSIIGFSDLLTEQELTITPEKRLGFLEHVAGSARHLLNLINDLLDIAKVESGKLKLNLEPVDLRLSVANTVASMQPLFVRKHQQVAMETPDIPMLVRADSARIEQVLLNLLSNANKFSGEGDTIRVGGTRAGDMWQIEVADQGIGIAAEDQRRVFDEFEQVHSRGAHSVGTGLGLALARRFVQAHGGTIEVESQLGQGAVFRIRLPAFADAG